MFYVYTKTQFMTEHSITFTKLPVDFVLFVNLLIEMLFKRLHNTDKN